MPADASSSTATTPRQRWSFSAPLTFKLKGRIFERLGPQKARISNCVHRVEVSETATKANETIEVRAAASRHRVSALLDNDPELTRADLARRLGISRAAVTQALRRPNAVSVREKLRALGITDRKGRPWSSSSIEAILRNPIYVGHVRTPDGNTRPGIHEAIISSELWDRVQAAKPTRTQLMTKIERTFPLAGLLECGACSSA